MTGRGRVVIPRQPQGVSPSRWKSLITTESGYQKSLPFSAMSDHSRDISEPRTLSPLKATILTADGALVDHQGRGREKFRRLMQFMGDPGQNTQRRLTCLEPDEGAQTWLSWARSAIEFTCPETALVLIVLAINVAELRDRIRRSVPGGAIAGRRIEARCVLPSRACGDLVPGHAHRA